MVVFLQFLEECRPASFRSGSFRSVAALVLLGSLGTVGGRAGYSVVKVQLKEAFIYSDICNPKSQGVRERFLKILSLIRNRGGAKVNPGSETFLKVPSLIPTFRPPFVNPISEKTSETPLGDVFGHHLRGSFGIKFCRGKVLSHIRTFGPPKVKPPTEIFLR